MSEDNEKYTASTRDKIDVDYDVPPTEEYTSHGAILSELADLKQFIIMQSGGHIRRRLFELPENIRAQSLKLAELTNHIEAIGLSLAQSKNQALELVLSATETDMGKTKQKYSNEQSRKVALESLLRGDMLYLENIDELSRKECELRKEQIQLDYLENMFLAYRAISGMREMR